MEAGTDIAGGLASALVGLGVGGPAGELAGGTSGPAIAHTALFVASEIKQRWLGPREEQRIGAALIFAGEKVRENREKGWEVRDDGFFQRESTDRAAAEEVFERVLLVAQREPQEKKLRFYGNLVANIAFHTPISREHANLLIKTAADLTYRQLCLLTVFMNADVLGDALRQTNFWEEPSASAEQLPLLQEAFDLYNSNLINNAGSAAMLGMRDLVPAGVTLDVMGESLYSLMELWLLDEQDVNRTVALLR